MSEYYILNERGDPVAAGTAREWAEWMVKSDTRVARTDIGGVTISTIFLGMDHSFGDVTPILFETVIFGGADDGYEERYTTLNDAVAGHRRAVDRMSVEVSRKRTRLIAAIAFVVMVTVWIKFLLSP